MNHDIGKVVERARVGPAPPIDEFLAQLPDSALVCEVGGGSSRRPRVDWVIDALAFSERAAIHSEDRVNAEQWTNIDICAPGSWPIPAGKFDFVICSHTLEDVRDPLHVISEMRRVARAGYIECPSRAYESSRRAYQRVPGSHHHRWLVEAAVDGSLVFTPKHGWLIEYQALQVHRRLSAHNDTVRLYWHNESAPLKAIEKTFVSIDDLIAFRSAYEDIPSEQVRRELRRETNRKRVIYWAARNLGLR